MNWALFNVIKSKRGLEHKWGIWEFSGNAVGLK